MMSSSYHLLNQLSKYMTLLYRESTDDFVMIVDTKLGFVAEVVTHEHLNYLQSLYKKPVEHTFYELVEMFPTAVPLIKNNLIREIKAGRDVAANRVKYNFFNPYKKNFGISGDDIARAKTVPISTFMKIPTSRKVPCLFHADKNPSMHVYKSTYYCFTCQAHGTTIDIIMKLQNKTFKEAVNLLSGK